MTAMDLPSRTATAEEGDALRVGAAAGSCTLRKAPSKKLLLQLM